MGAEARLQVGNHGTRRPRWLSGEKNPPDKAGDTGSIPGWARSPGDGNGYPLQYSCLENPMDRGAWWTTVHGDAKELDTTERLNYNNNHGISKISYRKSFIKGPFPFR